MSMTFRRFSRRRVVIGTIVGLLAFVCIQCLIGLMIEFGPKNLRDPEYSNHERRIQELIERRPNSTGTLYLGSSRMMFGIDAKRLTEDSPSQKWSYNFSFLGGGPIIQKMASERILNWNSAIDEIVIEVNPDFMNQSPCRDDSLFDPARLTHSEWREIRPFTTRPGKCERLRLIARLSPLWRHRAELRESCGFGQSSAWSQSVEESQKDEYGMQPRKHTGEEIQKLTELAKRQYGASLENFRLNERKRDCLESVVRSWTEHNVKVTLLLMPESSTFRARYSPVVESGIGEMLQNWRATYGCRVIDARTWMSDDDFFDGHHLQADSAGRFTERLKQEMERR